jgi:rare lipoprotein A
MGVANKTLPCGTHVRVCLNPSGPCVDVTVVDRGPYVAGREYDLTEATARAIGFLSRGVGLIWVAVI